MLTLRTTTGNKFPKHHLEKRVAFPLCKVCLEKWRKCLFFPVETEKKINH